MDFPDVNILIAGFRPDAPCHAEAKTWLESALSSGQTLALFPMVEAGFLRIVTHPKIFNSPSLLEEAAAFLQTLSEAPTVESALWAASDRDQWLSLCRQLELTGNDVNDAMLAAVSITRGWRLVSFDEGFARFPRLNWWNPAG